MASGARDIIQIVPAAGWAAIHEHEGEVINQPLACFALLERKDGSCEVVGMESVDAAIRPSEDQPSYLGYAYVGDEAVSDRSDFVLEAQRRQAKRGLETEFEL